MQAEDWLGRVVVGTVEAPAGSFVKRRADGAIDVVSPLPVPWNYGSIDGAVGADGDPVDAVWLGPRVPAGQRTRGEVCGVVRFVDAGLVDDKLIVGPAGRGTRVAIELFFGAYTVLKRAQAAWRGTRGRTGVDEVLWRA